MLFNGLFGAFAGGFLLDRLGGSHGHWGASRASFMCSAALFFCATLGIAAFFVNNIYGFFSLLTVSLFFGMSSTSPNSTIFLSVVDRSICNFSIGFQILMIHLCGDFPSPVLFGLLTDGLGGHTRALRTSVIFLWAVLLLSVVFYFFAGLSARSRAQRLERDAQKEIVQPIIVVYNQE